MSHLDPEQLALIALGEPVASDAELEHLSGCAVCTADVAEMTHAAGVARSTMDEIELEIPPERVWSRIAEELGLGDASDDAARPADPAESSMPGSAMTVTDAASPAEASAPVAAPDAGEVERPAPDGRRRTSSRRGWWALAASVALLLVIGGGVWFGLGSLAPTSIASASLEAFPDHPKAVGTAEVDESRDGTRTLTVTLQGASSSPDYREVWLIRNDGKALISLGVLDGAKGSFAIPAGVDLAQYDLVDISFEPVDGNPAHSGDSIVRGQLAFA